MSRVRETDEEVESTEELDEDELYVKESSTYWEGDELMCDEEEPFLSQDEEGGNFDIDEE